MRIHEKGRSGPKRWRGGQAGDPRLTLAPRRPHRTHGYLKDADFFPHAAEQIFMPAQSSPLLRAVFRHMPGPDALRRAPWAAPALELLTATGWLEQAESLLPRLYIVTRWLHAMWLPQRDATDESRPRASWEAIPLRQRTDVSATVVAALRAMATRATHPTHGVTLRALLPSALHQTNHLASLLWLFVARAGDLITSSQLRWVLRTAAAYYQLGDAVVDVDYCAVLSHAAIGTPFDRFGYGVEAGLTQVLARRGYTLATLPSIDCAAGDIRPISRCDYLIDGHDLLECKSLCGPNHANWQRALITAGDQLLHSLEEHGEAGPLDRPRDRWLVIATTLTDSHYRDLRRTIAADPKFGRTYTRVGLVQLTDPRAGPSQFGQLQELRRTADGYEMTPFPDSEMVARRAAAAATASNDLPIATDDSI